MKLLLFLSVIIVIFNSVSALGVIPARTNLPFLAGQTSSIPFTVVNTEHTAIHVTFSLGGELQQLLAVPPGIDLGPDASQEVRAPLTMPDTLSPGNHDGFILITEAPLEHGGEGASVIVSPAVITSVRVIVPYPGKYADARIDVLEGTQLQFFVALTNLGTESISQALATVDIVDDRGRVVTTLPTLIQSSIAPKQVAEFAATLSEDMLASGNYVARATVLYDGSRAVTEHTFVVEKEDLVIQDVVVKEEGQRVALSVAVVNQYQNTLQDVYAEFILTDAMGNVIARVRTPSAALAVHEPSTLKTYWESTGDAAEFTSVRAIVYYAGKTVTQEWTAHPDEVQSPSLVTARVIAPLTKPTLFTGFLAVAIIALIFATLWLLRRRKAE